MNIKNKTELDFIDIVLLFYDNKKIIIISVILSILLFSLYYFVIHNKNYISKIEIVTNNDLFSYQDSPIAISDEILKDNFVSQFYDFTNYDKWSKNISNLYFLKSEFYGTKNDTETFYRSGRDGKIYYFSNSEDDNILFLSIASNDKKKISQILNYSHYINDMISNDLIISLEKILSDYIDDTDTSKNINKTSSIRLKIENIKENNLYVISNPSMPKYIGQSSKKILILFLFSGLSLSFLFIIFNHFYNLKLLKKKYK